MEMMAHALIPLGFLWEVVVAAAGKLSLAAIYAHASGGEQGIKHWDCEV